MSVGLSASLPACRTVCLYVCSMAEHQWKDTSASVRVQDDGVPIEYMVQIPQRDCSESHRMQINWRNYDQRNFEIIPLVLRQLSEWIFARGNNYQKGE